MQVKDNIKSIIPLQGLFLGWFLKGNLFLLWQTYGFLEGAKDRIKTVWMEDEHLGLKPLFQDTFWNLVPSQKTFF